MDRDGRRPVSGDSAAVAAEAEAGAMDDDGSSPPAAADAIDDDGSSSTAAAEAMDDDGSSSPASYIRLVQHLIEKCICYNMNKQECVQTLEKHANIQPVITSTVWKELEKENREFFDEYTKDRPGGESTQKNPSDEQTSAPRSSDDDDKEEEEAEEEEEEGEQPSAPKSTDPPPPTSSLPLPTRAQTTTTRSSLPLPRAQKKTTTTRTRNYGAQHAW